MLQVLSKTPQKTKIQNKNLICYYNIKVEGAGLMGGQDGQEWRSGFHHDVYITEYVQQKTASAPATHTAAKQIKPLRPNSEHAGFNNPRGWASPPLSQQSPQRGSVLEG
jgi:hypothetical protein